MQCLEPCLLGSEFVLIVKHLKRDLFIEPDTANAAYSIAEYNRIFGQHSKVLCAAVSMPIP
jgi:hypothetical protein